MFVWSFHAFALRWTRAGSGGEPLDIDERVNRASDSSGAGMSLGAGAFVDDGPGLDAEAVLGANSTQ